MRFDQLSLTYRGAVVFLDVDGTLVPDGGHELAEASRTQIEALKRHNEVHLVSNGDGVRTGALGAALGVHAFPKSHKPFPPHGARAVARDKETIVIGDKFLSDGLFACLVGATFVRVDPHRGVHDSLFMRLLYVIDGAVWNIVAYATLIRPQQWIKNLLVFAPLFFAGAFFEPGAFVASWVAFVAFSLAASAVYIINDLIDRPHDLLHPTKRRRPLASGRISPLAGLSFAVSIIAVLALVVLPYPHLALVLSVYGISNILYCTFLKHIPVVDVVLVACFYLLRIIAGGAVTNIPLSPWILGCAFFVALFAIVGKRRAELRHVARRPVLAHYTARSLDTALVTSAFLAVLTYALYTVIGHPLPYLWGSTAFVAFALLRVVVRMRTYPDHAESPEHLLVKDPLILAASLAWAAYVFVVFYYA